MYYQGLDKLVNQKMSDRLAAEESSLNAAYVSVRTWAAYFANDEGLNVKCLKELLGQCAGIITQLEKAKKDVKKSIYTFYTFYLLIFLIILIILLLLLLNWCYYFGKNLFTFLPFLESKKSMTHLFTFLLFYFFTFFFLVCY